MSWKSSLPPSTTSPRPSVNEWAPTLPPHFLLTKSSFAESVRNFTTISSQDSHSSKEFIGFGSFGFETRLDCSSCDVFIGELMNSLTTARWAKRSWVYVGVRVETSCKGQHSFQKNVSFTHQCLRAILRRRQDFKVKGQNNLIFLIERWLESRRETGVSCGQRDFSQNQSLNFQSRLFLC